MDTRNSRYGDVWRAVAAALPERRAIVVDGGDTWTYARFARDAAALAAGLAERGIRPGDRVALLLHNRAEFLVTVFACLASGVTPVPLNFRLRSGEVADLLDDSGARALVYPTSSTDVVVGALERASDLVVVRIDDDGASGSPGEPWERLVARPSPLPENAPDGELWIYTGGTTGRPKGVRWDAADLFAAQQHSAYTVAGYPRPETLAEAVAVAVATTVPMVTLPLAPLMHGTALCTSMNTLLVGGTVVLTGSPRLDAGRAVEAAVEQSATRLIVAGDAVALPIVEAAERLGVGLPRVRTVLSSGMRLGADTKRRLHALGELEIVDILASSEGGGFAVTRTRSADDLPGTPELFPTAIVVTEELEEVQDVPGATGILAQRGRLPLGYHGDPEKTAAAFPTIAGVRHVVPGDWVRVLPGRRIEFLGRRSGVINTGGEKVYPPEVEDALLLHPSITDAHVVGIPDARFGEIVAAVVVTTAPVTPEEIDAHLAPVLAGFKKPRRVRIATSLDRSPTGKVDTQRWRRTLLDAD